MSNTRRSFLKKTGFATAGLVAGGIGFPAKSYTNILGANDRVVVGVVGFSDRARSSLIPSFMKYADDLDFEIKGISDIWSRRRNEGVAYMKERFERTVRTYRNNEELYADKDIDAVIISTADFQHAVHTIEAAENGKDAFVEKPFAETMEDNRNALNAVRNSGIVVQIGTQRRSGINYKAAYDFINSGKFGDITFVEMTWNVNQPGRWRRPVLVADLKRDDVDWGKYLVNRPYEQWDPRKYIEYRLFWPYSSGIPGQWMCHQIDTVHWFTGYSYPRSVIANGGIYVWHDGRSNYDTMTAVFDYGPEQAPREGFQVVYSSRMHNSAGGIKEIYYSNGGELNLNTNKVSSNGGLTKRYAGAMGMQPNLLPEIDLADPTVVAEVAADTGEDSMTGLHMLDWMRCVRNRSEPSAPIEAGYYHSIATIMVTAALRTKQYVTFDKNRQEVIAGGKIFHM
jgi:predicted dehydrogenase